MHIHWVPFNALSVQQPLGEFSTIICQISKQVSSKTQEILTMRTPPNIGLWCPVSDKFLLHWDTIAHGSGRSIDRLLRFSSVDTSFGSFLLPVRQVLEAAQKHTCEKCLQPSCCSESHHLKCWFNDNCNQASHTEQVNPSHSKPCFPWGDPHISVVLQCCHFLLGSGLCSPHPVKQMYV